MSLRDFGAGNAPCLSGENEAVKMGNSTHAKFPYDFGVSWRRRNLHMAHELGYRQLNSRQICPRPTPWRGVQKWRLTPKEARNTSIRLPAFLMVFVLASPMFR